MFSCSEEIYLLIKWADQGNSKNIINLLSTKSWFKFYRTFIKPVCFMEWQKCRPIIDLARGDPIATPSSWLERLLLNVKNDSWVTKFSRSQK